EPARRPCRATDGGGGTEGGAGGASAHLRAPRELHRERRRRVRGRRESTDGSGPAGGVGAKRRMAGARGPAPRQLVSRLLGRWNRRRRARRRERRATPARLVWGVCLALGGALGGTGSPRLRESPRPPPDLAVPQGVLPGHA